MNAQVFLPSERLAPFIHSFMIIESAAGMINTILPDIHMVMAFCFRGKVSYQEAGELRLLPPAAISGLRQSARVLEYHQQTSTLLVKFTEAGAAAFLPVPPAELFNHTVAADQVMAQQVSGLCEQLAAAGNHGQRIILVENMLRSWIDERKADDLIGAAMAAIKGAAGNLRIKELASALYISQDPFEKRFRQVTGTSPKQFAEIVRLRALIKEIGSFRHLGTAAHAFGFFDQAHFIRSFKAFTGQAPKTFFRNARYW
jgi:AraC-like DNA-binding protein